MPTTSPDNIYYADTSTSMSAEAISAAEATSVQAALNAKINNTRQIQSFVWANAAARTAQTGMNEGDWGFQQDTDVTYRYANATWSPYYPGGMVPVVPGSVSGTGVSVNAAGAVTFTNTTSMVVNGVFTSAFRNYRIVLDSTGTAATHAFYLRASGTTSITGYDGTELVARNATATSATLLNQAAWVLLGWAQTNAAWTLDVFAPQLALPTRGIFAGGSHANPAALSTANGFVSRHLSHRPTTAYDGLVIEFSAAQTGTVRVYGMA